MNSYVTKIETWGDADEISSGALLIALIDGAGKYLLPFDVAYSFPTLVVWHISYSKLQDLELVQTSFENSCSGGKE
jgi:hypothetical protein